MSFTADLTQSRARKVKCDEGKPACNRCVSTGRNCDGYGIWGGGHRSQEKGSHFSSHQIVQRICPQAQIPAQCYTADEKTYMSWFQLKTITKIPGTYANGFWLTLLQQASRSEPAVFYAILTLSSAHRVETRSGELSTKSLMPDGQKRFMLHSYSKAINHLQPHLIQKAATSTRVVLIACIVFTCLEFLRGNFETAQNHLSNASTDCWIGEVFQRLQVQVELFHGTHYQPLFVLLPDTHQAVATKFHSVKDAWTELDRIFYKIIVIKNNHSAKQLRSTSLLDNGACNTALVPYRQHIQSCLDTWYTAYESFRPILNLQDPDLFINAILRSYYTLAAILCSASLSNELAYDALTPQFLRILSNAVHLWKSRPPHSVGKGSRFDMAHSTVDFGWIPPLYYTAIKCRIRSVRLHALQLLQSTIHREGIWDCWIASKIVRKVMEIEDEKLYEKDISEKVIGDQGETGG
ncbi:hypothetical protein GRF29_103g1388894 [Pseudopithomyces chartarum]|uniref:Zn(2)-C6 fungal-type domain-containing protein n=1 Tax=Pseudopithomyces chartarum TaxID=1892770 RepID=A0AAN6RHP5_9PLEO|nr:hypothetical protein GRF29_103g1388894 [Pseudopithomyces chartarum]